MMRRIFINRILPLIFSLIVIGSLPIVSDGSNIDSGADPSTDPVTARDIDIYTEICTWYEDCDGALSFTFDDGLSSQADIVSHALHSCRLNGTFFVTVGNVGIPYGAEWSEWQEASDYGHEIGAHTITHPDLTTLSPGDLWDEVVFAKQMIEANLTDVEVETMSYPMGKYDSTVTSLVEQHYVGARGDRHNVSASPAPNPDTPENIYGVVPVNFGSSESLQEMNDLVDDTIDGGGWLVEMIHAVHDGGYDPVPFDTFTDHLEDVSSRQDRLWVGTYADVTKYIRARDSSTVNIQETSVDRYDITLESPLDPDIFDHEITVKIMSPIDWIDISITKNEMVSLITPDILGGGGTILMNMNINETITVEKVNVHPVISIPSDPDFDGGSFTPDNGSSRTVFEFGMIYTSSRDRSPLNDPSMSIDINGDGDFSDVIGGFSEGNYSMIKIDGGDTDYTDGCGYHLFLSLPPGSDPVILFNALDSMRLEATGVITSEIPGPHMNDPPGPPSNLRIESPYDVTPVIMWDPSSDPDGDDIVYTVDLTGGYLNIRNDITDTRFELDTNLEFDTTYDFTVYSSDDEGERSEEITLLFALRNRAPGNITDLWMDYDDDLILTINFSEAVDPDGDGVFHRIDVIKDPHGKSILTAVRNLTDETEFKMDIPLSDHTDYRVRISPFDIFGMGGPVTIHDFRANIPPAPVQNLSLKDVEGVENALDITWDPSPEDDFHHYMVYREKGYAIQFDEGNTTLYRARIVNSIQYDVGNTTFYRDTGVEDGTLYQYWIAAVDNDGAVDLVNINYVIGVPLDDVAPDRISNLTAADTYDATYSVSLKWSASSDERFHHYRIYRRNDTLNQSGLIHVTRKDNRYDNSWIDPIAINDITYFYAVTAVDSSGNENLSDLIWVEGMSIDDTWVPRREPYIDETVDSKDRNWIPILVIFLIILGIIALVVGIRIYLIGRPDQDEDHEFD